MKPDSKLAETISSLAEKGKKKKQLRYEEVTEELKGIKLEPNELDDILEHLQSLGITVGTESEEDKEENKDEKEKESVEDEEVVVSEGVEVDDPVRMYLKEIGRV